MKFSLSSALVLLSLATSVAAQPSVPSGPGVIVTTGEGIVKRAPDRAWVTVAAESHAKTAQEAQRMNAEAMTAVVEKIKAAGVPADGIQTIGYNLQPEFTYANGKQTLRGYIAKNAVQVRVDSLAKTGDIIAAAVSTGATNVSNIRFDLKDRDAVEREALKLAVRDARGRADAIGSGAGVTIDRVLRIEEQRDSDMGRSMPMSISSVAETVTVTAEAVPIEAGEIEVRARVTLTVAIR